jgi:hypothetical protein
MDRDVSNALLAVLVLILMGTLEPHLAAGQGNGMPTGSDFEVIQAPKRKNIPCAPVFFCRTRSTSAKGIKDGYAPAIKSYTERKQVRWCQTYAAIVLGNKVAAQQMVLVQIDPTVDGDRFKKIALNVAKSSKCSKEWPPSAAPMLVSKKFLKKLSEESPARWARRKQQMSPLAEILDVPVLMEESPERGAIILQPSTGPTDPVDAARSGPDYTMPGAVPDIEDLPSEKTCECRDILEQAAEYECACEATNCPAQ